MSDILSEVSHRFPSSVAELLPTVVEKAGEDTLALPASPMGHGDMTSKSQRQNGENGLEFPVTFVAIWADYSPSAQLEDVHVHPLPRSDQCYGWKAQVKKYPQHKREWKASGSDSDRRAWFKFIKVIEFNLLFSKEERDKPAWLRGPRRGAWFCVCAVKRSHSAPLSPAFPAWVSPRRPDCGFLLHMCRMDSF